MRSTVKLREIPMRLEESLLNEIGRAAFGLKRRLQFLLRNQKQIGPASFQNLAGEPPESRPGRQATTERHSPRDRPCHHLPSTVKTRFEPRHFSINLIQCPTTVN